MERMDRLLTIVLLAVSLVACTRVPATPRPEVQGTIASTSDPSACRTPTQAAHMIQDYLASQKPDLNPDIQISVVESPVQEAWERMQVQVFRITEGLFASVSYVQPEEKPSPKSRF